MTGSLPGLPLWFVGPLAFAVGHLEAITIVLVAILVALVWPIVRPVR